MTNASQYALKPSLKTWLQQKRLCKQYLHASIQLQQALVNETVQDKKKQLESKLFEYMQCMHKHNANQGAIRNQLLLRVAGVALVSLALFWCFG